MAIRTIIGIALIAFAAVLLFVVLGPAVRQWRTAHRRVQAGAIRGRAAERSHTVSECEALAEQIAAQARLAHAEGDAKTAHAADLERQAQTRRSDVATACADVKKEFERVKKELARADAIDPDFQTHDTPSQDTRTRQTPPATPATHTARDRCAELDDAAHR